MNSGRICWHQFNFKSNDRTANLTNTTFLLEQFKKNSVERKNARILVEIEVMFTWHACSINPEAFWILNNSTPDVSCLKIGNQKNSQTPPSQPHDHNLTKLTKLSILTTPIRTVALSLSRSLVLCFTPSTTTTAAVLKHPLYIWSPPVPPSPSPAHHQTLLEVWPMDKHTCRRPWQHGLHSESERESMVMWKDAIWGGDGGWWCKCLRRGGSKEGRGSCSNGKSRRTSPGALIMKRQASLCESIILVVNYCTTRLD